MKTTFSDLLSQSFSASQNRTETLRKAIAFFMHSALSTGKISVEQLDQAMCWGLSRLRYGAGFTLIVFEDPGEFDTQEEKGGLPQ